MSNNADIGFLSQKAGNIRIGIIQSLTAAESGHLGGSLGLADIFAALYFHLMRHRPENPSWPERDKLVLSIGHVAPVLYASLAEAGYFHKKELLTLRKLNSRLQGHPGKDHGLPGIELSAGSLGQGLSVAVGMAIADQMDAVKRKIYCVLGDGELQEGSVWEAAMSASHHRLGNLIALVDRNCLQIDGPTEAVLSLEPLQHKWEAFGWKVFNCDGNDISDVIEKFEKAQKAANVPSVIIAQTTMGKGIRSIEGDHKWHGKAPSRDEEVSFIREIKERYEL